MKIDRRLYLVQNIETDAGVFYLHSAPISREVWESYFLVLSKTYAAILSEGLNILSGPPIARMLLQRIAEMSGVWDGPAGVKEGLISEIRRLTNVVMPMGGGWQTLPYEEVVSRGLIDDDALADAEGAIVFFICVSAVLRAPASRKKLDIMMDGLRRTWDVSSSSLDVMAFAASLPTSTPAGNIGVNPAVSSVPH